MTYASHQQRESREREQGESGGLARTSSPVLVGRSTELHTLVGLVRAAPAVALVEGESGVGKSRLVRELLGQQALAGYRVLVGNCQPLREPFPFGAVVEALRGVGERLPAPTALSPVTGALRALLPELAAALPAAPEPLGEPGAERHQVFRAVRELLSVLGPSVLVIEDLHWADDGSRQLLRFVMNDPPPNLAVVVTYRREDAPGGMPLGCAYRPPGHLASALICLRPLDADGVRSLTAAIVGAQSVSPEFAAKLHERTSGIPFVVEETLHALRNPAGAVRADGDTARRLLENLEVPVLLREAMAERLAGLPAAAVQIAQAAAVLQTACSVELLARVAAIAPGRAMVALVRALETSTLHEVDECRYAFRHALAQQAVYDSLTGPARQLLHLRALRALADLEPKPLVQLAEHSRRAGRFTEWLRYAEAAADLAIEVGDATTAAGLLLNVVEAPQLPEADLDRLAAKFGWAAADGTDQYRVTTALRRLLKDPRLSVAVRGEVRLSLGRLLVRQADGLESSRAELELAIGDLADRPDLAARGMSVLARPFVGLTPLAEHLPWMCRVEEFIDHCTDQHLVTTLLANTLASRLHIGDPTAWTYARRLPAEAGCAEEQRQLARAHLNLGDACAWIGHYRKANEYLESGLRLAAGCGAQYTVSTARATQVHVDWLTGTWSGLTERATALLDEYRHLLPVATELSLVLGLLAAARGERAEAQTHLANTNLGTPQDSFTPVVITAHGARVRMALSQDPDQVAVAVEEADRGMVVLRRKAVWAWAGELVPLVVAAYCRAGRLGKAAAVVAETERGIAGRDAPLAAAALQACRALLAEARGSTGTAVEHFELAREQYEELPAPYYAALMSEYAACCRLTAGDLDAARALAELADRFDLLGATRDAARCRHLLRTRGGAAAPSRRGRRGYGNALSPREQDVARLLGHGHTNREIADVLYLSPRTVEQHVARVLRKLGLTSRNDLASR